MKKNLSYKSEPIRCTIDIEATKGTPALKVIIARILKEHGARVRLRDRSWPMAEKVHSLKGLHVTL